MGIPCLHAGVAFRHARHVTIENKYTNMKYINNILSIPIVALIIFTDCSSSGNPGNQEEKAIADKPNVIFVLADQWRAQAMGYAGNEDVKTPNLDQLAKESVVFKTAVAVMPVCSPFRASLLTGQYPLTHGVFYNDKPLRNEALTMAEIYKKAGYQTGYIGKWHLNGHAVGEDAFSARSQPVPESRRQGFDYWKVREVTHNYNNSYYFDENNEKHTWQGYDAFPQTDSAISYIQRMKGDPFLLFLSWGPPHNPYATAPEEYRQMYDADQVALRENVPEDMQNSARQVLAGYYAHCTALDKAMGDLLKAIEEEGLADNTIVVFTSDHGDMLLSRGEQRKQRPWDESILVPMLLRYPERLGSESKQISKPINTPDILPTLLGLSNLEVPASVEGVDLSKALAGEQAYTKEAALLQFPVPFHEWNFQNGGREYRAIRSERYTYVRNLKGPWLLYDNEQDPYQQRNLIHKAEYAEIQRKLDKVLQQKLKATHDDFLPADEYMKMWNYRYDRKDSLRPATYYSELDQKNIVL
jgi:arylsulfatase A-like enzyme